MNTLTVKTAEQVRAKSVRFTGNVIRVRFDDGREVSLPFNEAPWLEMAGEGHTQTTRELDD